MTRFLYVLAMNLMENKLTMYLLLLKYMADASQYGKSLMDGQKIFLRSETMKIFLKTAENM